MSSLFQLKESYTVEQAEEELREAGGEEIYVIEDISNHSTLLGARFVNPEKKFTSLDLHTANVSQEIDWEEQWRQHTNTFSEGILTLSLEEFKPKTPPVYLLPSGAFGDLTHPTTRLMLRLLTPLAEGNTVLDIGSGSGILSFAAVKMGANFAFGIEINDNSLFFSKKNCVLNQLENCILFSNNFSSKNLTSQPLLLMNMITSEQIEAWNSLQPLSFQPLEILTSGVLKSQRISYLQLTETWNWNLLEEIEEEDWMAFRFTLVK